MNREATLEVGDPTELCEQYIAQNDSPLSEEMSIEAVINAGYAPLLKEMFEWFIDQDKGRINTFVVQGATATGKTQIKERIEEIFPCQQYIQ